nr:hypothetical protein [Tanacetum cinerariifolium]
MSSFNQCECLGCGQPCDGYHYSCTCQQCGVILLNGICLNCIHGDGKPITCCECEGPLRGGFCLFCDSKAENSFTYDPNAYSFNDTSSNFNYLPQPQYKTYLWELCENNSHYGMIVNHSSRLGSHETFQCQPKDQNIDSSDFVQIQTPQYPVIDHPYQEMSKEVFQAKGNLMKSIQTFLEKFNCISFGEKPKILLQAWEKFFAIQHAQPEDTNELFQKLLEDLHIINEEMAEYINSSSWNRPTFYSGDEEHSKQNMEDTLLELFEVCRQKEFYCMHNDVDDLIESALNSKLLSINLKSQRLDKKKLEVKNIIEQSTKRGTRIAKSLQNFRVKKSSISLNNTSQISPSEEVIESSVKNLVPIPSEYEVTSDDESDCDVPVKDESSLIFTTFSNPIFDDNYDFTSSDDESFSNEDVLIEDFKVYSNPLFDDEEIKSDKIDPHYFNTEFDFIESLSNRDTLFDSSLKFDYLEEFSGELMPTTINSCPRPLENFHANTIIETLPTSPIPVEDRQVISVVINNIDELNEDECFDPRGGINVFANVEDGDYFPFIFVIQIFLPYLIYPEISPLLLSAGSKDREKITKKQSKPDKIENEIAKNGQKPDTRTFSVY